MMDGPPLRKMPTRDVAGERPSISFAPPTKTCEFRSPLIVVPVPETWTRAGAKPPVSSNPTGLFPQNVRRAPPMKLLSRLMSLLTVLKLFRVGTYAPAHGVTEKPPCATAGATPAAPSRATNAMHRGIVPPYSGAALPGYPGGLLARSPGSCGPTIAPVGGESGYSG